MVGSSSPFLFYASIPMRFRFHSFSKLKLTIEKTTPSSNVLRIGSTYKFVFQLATDFQSINDARNIACVKNFKSYLFLDVNFKIIQFFSAVDAIYSKQLICLAMTLNYILWHSILTFRTFFLLTHWVTEKNLYIIFRQHFYETCDI